ncbi:hypothetical protein TNCV_4740571, partial [Trichonephila clavipes]
MLCHRKWKDGKERSSVLEKLERTINSKESDSIVEGLLYESVHHIRCTRLVEMVILTLSLNAEKEFRMVVRSSKLNVQIMQFEDTVEPFKNCRKYNSFLRSR